MKRAKGEAKRKPKVIFRAKDGRRLLLSEAQMSLFIHLRELGLDPDVEYPSPIAERAWRFDLVLHEQRILIELHGGQFSGGHRRGWWSKKVALARKAKGWLDSPQEDEYAKLNMATMSGWRLLQFSNEQAMSGRAKQFLEEWLNGKS